MFRPLRTCVPVADSGSTTEFSWKWYLSELPKPDESAPKVFSCFCGGGGSAMGYRLAGMNVIGGVDIDAQMTRLFRKNLAPKYMYTCDIRDLVKTKDLPEELYGIDVLDGSPPCSAFSICGNREADWGRERTFREGQQKQTLDDLFFWFLKVVDKLKPKIVVAENVKGLVSGNARGYVQRIIERFGELGYDVQVFCMNAARMGVPQVRTRTVFVARRRDLGLGRFNIQFDYKPILFGEVRSEAGKDFMHDDGLNRTLLQYRTDDDTSIADIAKRVRSGKPKGYNCKITRDDRVSFTTGAQGAMYRMYDGLYYSDQDYINVTTFPQDYDFMGGRVQYICGMSVPPVMMANIANTILQKGR